MKANFYILKKIFVIFTITLTLLFLSCELLWLFAVPYFVNKKLSSDFIKDKFNQETKLSLDYTNAKIKTTPFFNARFDAGKINIYDKKSEYFVVEKLQVSVSLLDLLFKKLDINNLRTENLVLKLSREKDGKLYLGSYNLLLTSSKEDIPQLNRLYADTKNSKIYFEDKITNEKLFVKIPDFHVNEFKNNKNLDFVLNSEILREKNVSVVDAYVSTKLPVQKGVNENHFKLNGEIKNFNLADYSSLASYFSDGEIVKISGLLNSSFSSKDGVLISAKLDNFSIQTRNPLDSLNADSSIELNTKFKADKHTFYLKEFSLNEKNWKITADGNITDYTSKNSKLDVKINIPDSDVHSLYWLVPSIPGDPNEAIQKLKKYGAWGKIKGQLELKGTVKTPEVYGNVDAYDFYIVKNNPLVPHCKLTAEFEKDNVTIKTRVFTGYGEYVDVEGTAKMQIPSTGEFTIKSSENVDLGIAEYMLVPIHEVVGFELGPVPYMKISGKGNIELYTKGTVSKGIAIGQFNFKNTDATLQGLATKLSNADGVLAFDKRNLHFYTNHAYIKNHLIKIDGRASLDGDIDFDVTSPALEMDELLKILNESSLVADKKQLASPIEKVSGIGEVAIKIKGNAKNFDKILEKNTLDISGYVLLKNTLAKLKKIPYVAKNVNGKLHFFASDWDIDASGVVCSSKFKLDGGTQNKKTNLSFSADSLKTDDIIQEFLNDYYKQNKKVNRLNSVLKTNSNISVDAQYKSNSEVFDLKNLKAKGKIYGSVNQGKPIIINSGNFSLERGTGKLENFNALIYGSKINLDGKIIDLFSKNPIYTYKFKTDNFNVSNLNEIKKLPILPLYLENLLNAYENYSGKVDAVVECKRNNLKGDISLKDIKFNHNYFKTPVLVESGDINLSDNKINLKSLIATIDNTPAFVNASVWDLDKTVKFNGYFTTKLTDYFVNKYVNTKLTYPIKPKGDISVTVDLNGNAEQFNVKPKIILAKDADIYYMGANLGDEDTRREIVADVNIKGNNYFVKKAEYIRLITSQNNQQFPLTILSVNGVIQTVKNKPYIKNLNIETKNSANVKIFNSLFKKSVLKNGMFNCKLNVKGSLEKPVVLGQINMDNLEMPLYSTTLNNLDVYIKDKIITVKTDGKAYNSDFKVVADIRNSFNPPYIIENLEMYSKQINLDDLMDSLNAIPTPNTMVMRSEEHNHHKIPVDISDFQIKDGTMKADNIIVKGLPAINYVARLHLDDAMILHIDGLAFDLAEGKIYGTASYNFSGGKFKTDLASVSVDANKFASALFDFKDQIMGKANGNLSLSTKGSNDAERIKNLTGFVYFDIIDGKMPKLGSVEYLLKAGSTIKSGITGVSINSLIDLFNPIQTGSFDSIKGKISLKNGVAQDIEIFSKGDNLNLYINGDYDILQQYANLRVYGRLTKNASNILGPVGNLSFNSLLNAIPGIKLNAAEKTKLIKDLNKIPGVEFSDSKYRVFGAKIDGKINEDKYVRSFNWIE